ncbi:MAG: acyltransferase family protein [Limisphaerales bacterium]
MASSAAPSARAAPLPPAPSRLDHLDATRAFALVLGVVFHASLSFMPVFMGWAVQDVSTSPLVAVFVAVSHAFRMELFFLLAGFFSQVTLHRKGTADFIRSRAIRLGVPFVVGWFILRPLVISGWIMGSASLRGDADVRAGLVGGFQSLATLPAGIFAGSHLWFLYYLMLITALVLVARGLPGSTASWREALVRRADAVVAWLAHSPVSLPILAVPTAAALWFMSFWDMDTPDKSLWPHLPALAIYGGFFAVGWMLGRQRGLIPRLARLTTARWIMAAAGIAAILGLGGIERDPAHPDYLAAHVAYALGYALTMWSLVLLTIGVFRKLCPRPNTFIRYVADSSYWMYLIHLPIVVWLQVAVAELPLHWPLKLALVTALTVAISLLTYDLFVRSTFVGWVLNGRRRERVLPAWVRGVAGQFLAGNPLPSSRRF